MMNYFDTFIKNLESEISMVNVFFSFFLIGLVKIQQQVDCMKQAEEQVKKNLPCKEDFFSLMKSRAAQI